MNTFYAYTRVSTLKQGEKGVSLQEQHDAIARYAERQGLQIAEWFEERVTAAKQGRPLFARMLKGLRRGDVNGVIIHKIDRGARNLRDWSDLGELIDAGVSVHFANESLDLHSRGGRLSADIQAVVAADYVRNLREETIKGMRGRLKQGLFPFGAPLGYLNNGQGKPKTIDPFSGPLVRKAFELYALGGHTLDSLNAELHRRGLRNRKGRAVSINGLSRILNNSFYTGLIRIGTTGETYEGVHAPIVPMALFKQVQNRLTRRVWMKERVHNFNLRGLFQCALCGRPLVGERQKGNVYYRCHTARCATRTFREETLESALLSALIPISLTDNQRKLLLVKLDYVEGLDAKSEGERRAAILFQIAATKTRGTRLLDAFIDGAIDKGTFEVRKRDLLEEQRLLEESARGGLSDSEPLRTRVSELFELATRPQLSYRFANSELRREMALRLCSNRSVAGKTVSVEPFKSLLYLAKCELITSGDPDRDSVRTGSDVSIEDSSQYASPELEVQIRELLKWAEQDLIREQNDRDKELRRIERRDDRTRRRRSFSKAV